jgi:hypothetical protein
MDRIILLCAMLTVSFSVMAESQPWMKKDDPNSLGLYVDITGKDCPLDRKELKDMVEGEYLRARIKPTDDINDLNISINLLCQKSTMGGRHIGTTAAYTVYFASRVFLPKSTYVNYEPGFIIVLTGSPNKMEAKTSFLDSIREEINIMITRYLKANME